MSRLPSLTAERIIRALSKAGFIIRKAKGQSRVPKPYRRQGNGRAGAQRRKRRTWPSSADNKRYEART